MVMKAFVAAAGLLIVLPVSGKADPTFNGSFEVVTCTFNQMVVCENDFCTPDNTDLIKGQVTLNYADGSITTRGGRRPDRSPLEVIAVSEAKFGGTLWVRSRTTLEGATATIQTTYQPRGAGAYQAVAALQTKQGANVAIMSSSSCRISKSR